MFVFLSKLLPLLFYPLGAVCFLLLGALILNSRKGWRSAFIVLSFLILWLGGNRWVALPLARSLEWRYLPPDEVPEAEVIVVLGGVTEPMQYPRTSVEINGSGDRVLYAARLYHQKKAKHILLSGGNIDWLERRGSSPAEEMADIMHLCGVPDEALWLESESRNTYENALFSAKLLESKGVKRILLVTSALHMPRSVALFEHQGLEVIPVTTDFTVTEEVWYGFTKGDIQSQLIGIFPSTSYLSLTTNVIKEYMGMLVYRWRGWM